MRTQLLPLSPTPVGLVICVLCAVALATLVSVTLIVLLPGGEGSIDNALPGTGPLGALISRIVPFVWIGLFAGLGAAFWLVQRAKPEMTRPGAAVLALLCLCCLYPIVGAGLTEPLFAVVGNVAVILAAVITEGLCRPASHLAARLVTPVWVWVTIATAGLLALELGLPF
ncbi:MAG: tryptophan-rich sensory protein [Rhodobacterales bacterium]|nr:tryptophan-rich sensory protein [Rhodobacterales bacterium]